MQIIFSIDKTSKIKRAPVSQVSKNATLNSASIKLSIRIEYSSSCNKT